MNIDFTKPFDIQRELLFESDFYTEGPVYDGQDGIYFTTLTGGKVWHWVAGKGAMPWAAGGWPNGQVWFAGGLVVCDSINQRLARYDSHGTALTDVIKDTCAGKRISVPNDVIADQHGGLYFTDSVRHEGYVFYLAANEEAYVVAQGLDYPNGLVLTKDQDALIVAESYANRLLRIPLASPGIAQAVTILCTLPFHDSGHAAANLPDGLALDEDGRIWVAHYGMGAIQVVDKGGTLITTLLTGMPLTSNLCFGKENEVFVTGGEAEPGPGMLVKLVLKNS